MFVEADLLDSFEVHEPREAEDDNETNDEDEAERPAYESGPEIHVLLGSCDQTEEQEYYAVRYGTQSLDPVLHRRIRLFRTVRKSIALLEDSTANETDDAGPVDRFSEYVRHVGQGEYDEWLDDSGVSGQLEEEGAEDTEDDPNEETSEYHGEETGDGQAVLGRINGGFLPAI